MRTPSSNDVFAFEVNVCASIFAWFHNQPCLGIRRDRKHRLGTVLTRCNAFFSVVLNCDELTRNCDDEDGIEATAKHHQDEKARYLFFGRFSDDRT